MAKLLDKFIIMEEDSVQNQNHIEADGNQKAFPRLVKKCIYIYKSNVIYSLSELLPSGFEITAGSMAYTRPLI